jgi:hypothetical protein
VIVRLPSEGDSWRDIDNIQVEFGCARSAPVNQPDYLDEESDEVDEDEDTESADDTESTDDINSTEETEDTDDSQAPSDQSEAEPSTDESTADEPATEDSSSGEPTDEEAGSLSTEYDGNSAMCTPWSAKLASMAVVIAIARLIL